jgi:hypothetical protein
MEIAGSNFLSVQLEAYPREHRVAIRRLSRAGEPPQPPKGRRQPGPRVPLLHPTHWSLVRQVVAAFRMVH